MMLSVTEAAKAAGCARSTIYDKLKSGELSKTADGIDTAELLRVFGELKNHSDKQEAPAVAAQPVADDMALWFRTQLEETQQELKQSQAELADTQARLAEHRDNAKLLEDKSNEWQHALAARQSEIESARRESVELQERLQSESDARAKAEQLAKQLRNRGFIARLLNRQHEVI